MHMRKTKYPIRPVMQTAQSAMARRELGKTLANIPNCRIPDDCIDSKRYPLFMARSVLQELIKSLQSTQGVKPC